MLGVFNAKSWYRFHFGFIGSNRWNFRKSRQFRKRVFNWLFKYLIKEIVIIQKKTFNEKEENEEDGNKRINNIQ